MIFLSCVFFIENSPIFNLSTRVEYFWSPRSSKGGLLGARVWCCLNLVLALLLRVDFLPACGERGLLSSWGAWTHCGGFPCGAQALGRSGFSSCGHGLSFTGLAARACEVLVPGPGIESSSPALAGGFSTTGPPGKSSRDPELL